MKIAVVADTHFSDRKKIGSEIDNISFVFWNQLESFRKMLEYCEDNRVERLVHLGDVFDYSNPLSIEIEKVGAIIKESRNIFKQIDILVGNHDLSRKSYSFNWINEHVDCRCIRNIIEEDNIIYIPWIRGREEEQIGIVEEYLSKRGEIKGNEIIFGHFLIDGVDYGSKISKIGVALNILEGYRCYIGHIHKRQMIGKNIEYVGGLYSHNFGECDEQKGFVVIDI